VSQKVLSSFFPPPPASDLPGKEDKRAKNRPQKKHTKITENTLLLLSPPLLFATLQLHLPHDFLL
jgi:hypothetical protein